MENTARDCTDWTPEAFDKRTSILCIGVPSRSYKDDPASAEGQRILVATPQLLRRLSWKAGAPNETAEDELTSVDCSPNNRLIACLRFDMCGILKGGNKLESE